MRTKAWYAKPPMGRCPPWWVIAPTAVLLIVQASAWRSGRTSFRSSTSTRRRSRDVARHLVGGSDALAGIVERSLMQHPEVAATGGEAVNEEDEHVQASKRVRLI